MKMKQQLFKEIITYASGICVSDRQLAKNSRGLEVPNPGVISLQFVENDGKIYATCANRFIGFMKEIETSYKNLLINTDGVHDIRNRVKKLKTLDYVELCEIADSYGNNGAVKFYDKNDNLLDSLILPNSNGVMGNYQKETLLKLVNGDYQFLWKLELNTSVSIMYEDPVIYYMVILAKSLQGKFSRTTFDDKFSLQVEFLASISNLEKASFGVPVKITKINGVDVEGVYSVYSKKIIALSTPC